jgi:apolipoprotein N-acyltransferase
VFFLLEQDNPKELPMSFELTPEILFVIGIASSVIVWIGKVYLQRNGNSIPAPYLTAAVYVVSAAISFSFVPAVFPAFPSFNDLVSFVPAILSYLAEVIKVLSAFAGIAVIIYQSLLKKVLEGIAQAAAKK